MLIDLYYLLPSTLFVTDDTDRLKGFLCDKIAQRKKRIHPQHSPRFNHDMQLEIDFYQWELENSLNT
jgi:hypothetical protein